MFVNWVLIFDQNKLRVISDHCLAPTPSLLRRSEVAGGGGLSLGGLPAPPAPGWPVSGLQGEGQGAVRARGWWY